MSVLNITTHYADFYIPLETFPWWTVLRIIASIDIFILLLVIGNSVYSSYVIAKSQCLHVHFKVLILYYFGTLIVKAVLMILHDSSLCRGMPSFLPWTNKWFHGIGLGINTSPFIMPIIIFTERLIAAIKTKTYERYYNKLLLVILCGTHFTLSSLVTVNSLFNDMKQLYFFQLFLYLAVALIMTAYFIVYAITSTVLSKNKQNLNLSQKFQILENLKANRSMMIFAMLNLVTSVASVIFTCTLLYFTKYEGEKYDVRDIAVVSYAILNCVKGLCLFLAPFAFVWSQKKHTCKVLPTNMTDGEYHFELMKLEWDNLYVR